MVSYDVDKKGQHSSCRSAFSQDFVNWEPLIFLYLNQTRAAKKIWSLVWETNQQTQIETVLQHNLSVQNNTSDQGLAIETNT